MSRFLHDDAVWREIRRRAQKTKRLTAVVGYLGRHPEDLMRWPNGARILADLSEVTVRRGASSARGGLRLARRGIHVLQVDALHAKVVLFDNSAIVGSTNLSETSRDLLREAAVLLTSPREVAAVRDYVRGLLRNDAVVLDARILRQRAQMEPARYFAPVVSKKAARDFELPPRVWIVHAERD
jgi:phosphatidylserine/phosphatidylglycerophosphate/cardiolipin synthase-like enzyme